MLSSHLDIAPQLALGQALAPMFTAGSDSEDAEQWHLRHLMLFQTLVTVGGTSQYG